MDFDYTTETITPDSTNILTIGGTGGLELPSGTTVSRPTGENGMIRYNTTIPQLEAYINGAWTNIVSPLGTVTSVSVVLANGLAGTVATSSTTPAITLTTSVTGIVKGNGTALLAATAGTDYVIPSGLVATATNIDGGTANQHPYQTAAGATSFYSSANYGVTGAGATGVPQVIAGAPGVLVGSASAIPTFSTTPVLTGTNFTGIPNTGLTNSLVTIGSTSVALGATVTTIAGLTSATSTTFVGALSGNATSATTAGSATNLAGGAANQILYQTATNTTGFITNPTVSSTFLQWNGSAFVWSVAAGSSSPLTTKGDIYTYDTSNSRLPVGTDGQVLSADSASATGIKWINSGAGVTIPNIYAISSLRI